MIQKMSIESLRRLRDEYEVVRSIHLAKAANAQDRIREIEKVLNEKQIRIVQPEIAPKCSDHIIIGPAK